MPFPAQGVEDVQDLALHLVARLAGGREAVRIARIFLLGDRSEGQLLYAAAPRPGRHDDAAVARAQEWIAEHYDIASPVTRMVERSGLSERTFKRRFKAATGLTPIEYVQTLRVEEARQMLETGDRPTDAIACEVGYEDRFAPAPPRDLEALPQQGVVNLVWQGSPDADTVGYHVYRQEPGGDFRRLTTEPVTELKYTDSGLTPGLTFRYRLTAIDGAGNEGSPTAEVEARVSAP